MCCTSVKCPVSWAYSTWGEWGVTAPFFAESCLRIFHHQQQQLDLIDTLGTCWTMWWREQAKWITLLSLEMNSLVLCRVAMFLLLGLDKGDRLRWNYSVRLSNMTTEEGQLVTWAKQSDYESHSYCRPLFFTPTSPHSLLSPFPTFGSPLQYHKFNQIKCTVSIFISFASEYTLFILKWFVTQSPSGYKEMRFVFAISVKNPSHLLHKRWETIMKICF